MSCPVCAGATDPRERLLRTLCPAHLADAEASAPTSEQIEAAFQEGIRDHLAVLAGRLGLRVGELGSYRCP